MLTHIYVCTYIWAQVQVLYSTLRKVQIFMEIFDKFCGSNLVTREVHCNTTLLLLLLLLLQSCTFIIAYNMWHIATLLPIDWLVIILFLFLFPLFVTLRCQLTNLSTRSTHAALIPFSCCWRSLDCS